MAVKNFDELDKKLMKEFKTISKYGGEDEVKNLKEGIICPKNISQKGIDLSKTASEYLVAGMGFTPNLTEEELNDNIDVIKKKQKELFYRSEDTEKLKFKIKTSNEPIEIIDQIKVYSDDKNDDFLGDTANTGLSKMIVYEEEIKKNLEALNNFIWAKIKIGFNNNEDEKEAYYVVNKISHLSISNFDYFKKQYEAFLKECKFKDKIKLVLRSIGIEPDKLEIKDKYNLDSSKSNFRAKKHLIMRLVPFVENNYNLIEIGEKGIGKSYLQKLSPKTISHPAASVTYADLFGDNRYGFNTSDMGVYDVIFIDEISKGDFKEKTLIEKMNSYLSGGSYTAKGNNSKVEISSKTSFVFTGNNKKSINSLIRRKKHNLFTPCLGIIKNDKTVQDRINYYIPSWELKEFANDIQTAHLGLTADFFFKLLSYLREKDYTDILKDRGYESLRNVSVRDEESINMTVSGLVKLLHISPGNVSRETLEEYLRLAIEGRNRVKFQKDSVKSYEDSEIVYKDTEENNREISELPLELDVISKENELGLKSREVGLISERNMKDFNLELFERLADKLNNRESKIIAVNPKEFFIPNRGVNYNFELVIEKVMDEIKIKKYNGDQAPTPSPHIGPLFKKVSDSVGVETKIHVLDSYVKTFTVVRDKLVELFENYPEIQKKLRLSKNHFNIFEKSDYRELEFDPYINDDIKLEIGYEYNQYHEELLSCNYGGITIEVIWRLTQRRRITSQLKPEIKYSLSGDISNYI